MLRLHNISLYHFKNYDKAAFSFNKKVVAVCGSNGIGKTNLLDAIYIACFSKSYFSKNDAANVLKGTEGMRLEANFERRGEPEQIVCILRENMKKELLRNHEKYKQFSRHIGLFPAVMIAPDDVELITGGSEGRRRFLDTLLSQVDSAYLDSLISYNKVLQQRNSLLKAAADKGYVDEEILQILNEQLARPGQLIFEKRRKFLDAFLPAVSQAYSTIAGSSEMPELRYYSPLMEDSFAGVLQTFRQKDLLLQRTTAGIHKDDIEMNIKGESFRHIASQGQRKSLLFALKLAEFKELQNAKGFAPILLLDDVFEKLDAGRIYNLLKNVCTENDGQVFITDTHKERLQTAMEALGVDYQLIEL